MKRRYFFLAMLCAALPALADILVIRDGGLYVYDSTGSSNGVPPGTYVLLSGSNYMTGPLVVISNVTFNSDLTASGTVHRTDITPLSVVGSIAGTNQWDWSTLTMDCCGVLTQIVARGTASTGAWVLAQYSDGTDSSVVRTGFSTKVTAQGTFSTTGDYTTGTFTITNGNTGWLILTGDGAYPTNVMHWRGRGYQSVTY